MRTAALPEMREFFQSLKQEEDGALLSPLMLCGRLYELFDWLRQRQAGTAACRRRSGMPGGGGVYPRQFCPPHHGGRAGPYHGH